MIDYELLRLIWWALIVVLLIGFSVTDGFDLGVAALLPWVAKNDIERRVVINTVAPVWEGNQVWLILAAGAIFAAWPIIYSVAFSSLYLPMLLVLLSVGVVRPVGFKYRSKLPAPRWRRSWDTVLATSGLLGPVLFGIAVGNVMQGLPFHFDHDLRLFYTGHFFALFNPFALLCGLLGISMLIMHGGCYLAMKTTDAVKQRAHYAVITGAIMVISLFLLAGWAQAHLTGYALSKAIAHTLPSNPLHKTVIRQTGAWLTNYQRYPWTQLAPIVGVAGAALTLLANQRRQHGIALVTSGLSIAGIIATAAFSLFPFLLPSSSHPSASLIVWDASSSQMTLQIMLIVTAIFLPIILAYTSWVYRVMRGPITPADILKDSANLY